MEDAISMLTVIFLLFLIIFIPLVKLDREYLEKAKFDPFWKGLGVRLFRSGHSPELSAPYVTMFSLEYHKSTYVSTLQEKNLTYVESINTDSSITVIRHNRTDNTFVAMFVQDFGGSITYRIGEMQWSSSAEEWFPIKERIDYGNDSVSIAMTAEYKIWINSQNE